ncbi:hypothetical protein [Desulfomonile tiedjei]|uniref:Uncharacterized protein n=1 Tax=Desulfomonile tiedjei (strain ATCC 49306 / DSM 6799 / DCB-1) TaxID=706587 RepID=I4CCL7_DESTA|nr:hypothetical protein [Desulfomonile tiedjei]AFM27308.1 hypothetical protein Desti_4687 [Desulfomonile tiedjei DSM 6799]
MESGFHAEEEYRVDSFFHRTIDLFDAVDRHEKLFPKVCRACGRTYPDLSTYISETKPKGHTMDDCSEVMGKQFTMLYRHCLCGNTLVLTFTDDIFPLLAVFWSNMKEEARSCGMTLKDFTAEFVGKWELLILSRKPLK